MRKVIVQWMLRLITGTTGLILLIFLLLFGALYTNSGLTVILWGIQKAVPQFHVESTQGAIFPRFSLYNASFQNDDLHIDIGSREITLATDTHCFLSFSICVEQIKIDGLSVDFTAPLLPSEEEEKAKSSISETKIHLPIPIDVNRVELNDINFNVLGNKVDWKTLSTQLKMRGNTLTIFPTIFEDVNVELARSALENDSSSSVPEQQVASDKPRQPISLPDVFIPLEINLEQFDLARFTLKGDTPVIVNHLGLSAFVDEYAVNVKQLKLETPQADLELQTEIELRGDYPVMLDANALIKQTDLKGQTVALQADGSMADLRFTMQASDLIEVVLKGNIEPINPELSFDIAATDGHVQWPLTGVADYTVGIASLNVKGGLESYHLGLSTVVDGQAIPQLDITVEGEGSLDQIKLETILVKTLDGEVSGQVFANWQAPVNWEARLDLSRIQPGLEWEQAEGVINGSFVTSGQLLESGGWQVEIPTLDIKGMVRDYPFDIKGELNVFDKQGKGDVKVSTNGLDIKHGPNDVHISGKLDKKWDINTLVNFPEIDKTIPNIKGQISGDVFLRGELKEPEIQTNLIASHVSYLDMISLSAITVSGHLSPLSASSGDLNVSIDNVQYENEVIDSIKLSFEGSQKEHQLSLDVLSDLLNASIHIDGHFQQKPNRAWKGRLTRADLSTFQGPWKLEHQIELGFFINEQIAEVEAHCWKQADSKVCLTEDLKVGASGDIQLGVQNFALSQLAMFVPKEIAAEGLVDVTANVSWSENESPNLDVSVILPKGKVTQQLEASVELGWESIILDAQLHNDTLSASWLFDLTDNGDVKGNLKIVDVQSTHQGLDAQLILEKIDLDMIQPMLGEYSKANVEINSDIKVSGPVKHPKVNGRFVVDDIVLQGDVAPVEIEAGRFAIDFSGYDALLNAELQTPDGALQLDGSANWQDLKKWVANLKVFSEELDVDIPPMAKIKIKPNMQITMSPKLAKIEGDIYLPWGRINVEELPPSAVEVSSDEIILGNDLKPKEKVSKFPMEVETNVNIHMGDNFRLSAFGLRGELVGHLSVSQKDKGPFVIGEIEIKNGVYRSFGQDLKIVEGKVLMSGPVEQPYLAIEAIRNPDNTQDDVIAGIRVTGPANEPKIDVFSDPAMPQQNALSYLLRGQDIDDSSGGDAMTTALIGLSLAKSGRVVGQIGQTFGVSDLQLDTAGTGDDSQVAVSGYIIPKLQLKYGVGIFDSFGEFTIRYQLFTDLYLEAVSGVDNAVDLLYQFEFN